jgi:hypothetical protein
MMDTEDFDQTVGDDELFAGLRRSVGSVAMTTSTAEVVALGRRTRTRHRMAGAGIGTGVAAVVAAVGVLAPSAGTGAGSTSGDRAQGANTSQSAQTLDIRDVGFTLQKRDGVVDLTVAEVFDPAKLKAALDKAGVKNDVQEVAGPADPKTEKHCAVAPGVERDEKAMSEALTYPELAKAGIVPTPGRDFMAALLNPSERRTKPSAGAKTGGGSTDQSVMVEFHLDRIPAGDVVSVVLFKHSVTSLIGARIMTGMPGECVLVPGRPQPPNTLF